MSLRMTFSKMLSPEALVSLMSVFQFHINIFFLLQFNLHKSKQCSSASKNMYEWVCIPERERLTQQVERKEELKKKLNLCLVSP
jgi:hypothetical protein